MQSTGANSEQENLQDDSLMEWSSLILLLLHAV